MRIGAFIKQSFIDWEGHIAAVIFTKGCNFRCGFCHNPNLVIPELMNQTLDISETEVLDYLTKRKDWLDGVVITGGEPTIHSDLPIFLTKIKNLGYKIKLDTNGSNPILLEALIQEKLIDFVAMDIKTIIEQSKYYEITHNSNPQLTTQIISSINIMRYSHIPYQLRTTITPFHHNTQIINKLKQEFENENYVFQEFREGETITNIKLV